MLRRLNMFSSIVSLALCVATCVLWERSYRIDTDLDHYTRSRWTGLYTREGRLYLSTRNADEGVTGWIYAARPIADRDAIFVTDDRLTWDVLGAPAARQEAAGWDEGTIVWDVRAPFWMLACLFAVLPVVFVVRKVARRSRVQGGLCAMCGYDLRATPGRCPECGATTA